MRFDEYNSSQQARDSERQQHHTCNVYTILYTTDITENSSGTHAFRHITYSNASILYCIMYYALRSSRFIFYACVCWVNAAAVAATAS